MDLMQSFQTLRKRIKLTVALLILTLLATIGATVALPWSYQATGEVILLNSKAAQATYGNPYLSFDPALTTTANILSLQLAGTTVQQSLQARGITGSYTATVPSATGAPMVEIQSTASSRTVALDTMRAVVGQVNTQLAKLQGNIESKNLILTQVLSETPQATRMTSKKAKPLVVIFVFGLLLTFVIPQLVERRAARRRATRGSESHLDAPATREDYGQREEYRDDYRRDLQPGYTADPGARVAPDRGRQPQPTREPAGQFTPDRDGTSGQPDPRWR